MPKWTSSVSNELEPRSNRFIADLKGECLSDLKIRLGSGRLGLVARGLQTQPLHLAPQGGGRDAEELRDPREVVRRLLQGGDDGAALGIGDGVNKRLHRPGKNRAG
jgi:hypothetical protein